VLRTIGEGVYKDQHDPEMLAGGNILAANHGKPHAAQEIDPASGRINVSALAADMVASAQARFTTMVAALGSGFSSSVGSTGVNLSVDNWFSAVLTLELANVGGPYVAFLHSQQIGDLRTSLRSETGTIPLLPPSPAVIAQVGQVKLEKGLSAP